MHGLTPVVVVMVAVVMVAVAVVMVVVTVMSKTESAAKKAKGLRHCLRASLSLPSKHPGEDGRRPSVHSQSSGPRECGGRHVEAEDDEEQEDGQLHAAPAG